MFLKKLPAAKTAGSFFVVKKEGTPTNPGNIKINSQENISSKTIM